MWPRGEYLNQEEGTKVAVWPVLDLAIAAKTTPNEHALNIRVPLVDAADPGTNYGECIIPILVFVSGD
jgi:hypothetical protein